MRPVRRKTESMTRRPGWVLFLLYLTVLPLAGAWLQSLIFGDREVPAAEANVLYYGILFVLCLACFWGPLREDLGRLGDRWRENLLCIPAGLVGGVGLRWVLTRLPFLPDDPVPGQYAGEFGLSPLATLVLVGVLIPVVEEVLYRGFLYRTLRRYSRPLALTAVTLLWAFWGVWRYAAEYGDVRYLLLTAVWLPFSAALTLCCEAGESVWGCAVLHALFDLYLLSRGL